MSQPISLEEVLPSTKGKTARFKNNFYFTFQFHKQTGVHRVSRITHSREETIPASCYDFQRNVVREQNPDMIGDPIMLSFAKLPIEYPGDISPAGTYNPDAPATVEDVEAALRHLGEEAENFIRELINRDKKFISVTPVTLGELLDVPERMRATKAGIAQCSAIRRLLDDPNSAILRALDSKETDKPTPSR